MRVLVAHGSKMGGTEGLAEMLAVGLRRAGFDADVSPASDVQDLAPYGVVIVGGALYNNRWHKEARRFVKRRHKELRNKEVWLFSSGPLDDTAVDGSIAPVGHVAAAMALTGANGHMTFGGRLPADVKGFPAAAMAKTQAGDWRDPDHVHRWVTSIVEELSLRIRADSV